VRASSSLARTCSGDIYATVPTVAPGLVRCCSSTVNVCVLADTFWLDGLRITIRGTFRGIFARHVKLVLVEGMHILIPPLGSEHFKTPQRSSVVIDDLVADGTVLEVASREAGTPSLQFSFRGFNINNVGSRAPAEFKATISNPEPPGEIRSRRSRTISQGT